MKLIDFILHLIFLPLVLVGYVSGVAYSAFEIGFLLQREKGES